MLTTLVAGFWSSIGAAGVADVRACEGAGLSFGPPPSLSLMPEAAGCFFMLSFKVGCGGSLTHSLAAESLSLK